MQYQNQKAVVISKFGQSPHVEQVPYPQVKEGELLVKVEASTINPSDRTFFKGTEFTKPLPAICGLEGTGRVIEANGQTLQKWVGKRVTFSSSYGSWCQYSVVTPSTCFQITEEVPLNSAASGFVNPLTALAIVEDFKGLKCKGIILTAGSSSLGKMLIKLCNKENIELLSIVRKKNHIDELKNLGAKHVLLTQGNWKEQFKENYVNDLGFDCLYDCLGGGPTTNAIIENLQPASRVFIYSDLANEPLVIPHARQIVKGLKIEGFFLSRWWAAAPQQLKDKIHKNYNNFLINELSTKTYKELTLNDIDEALKLSVTKASEGKILLKID